MRTDEGVKLELARRSVWMGSGERVVAEWRPSREVETRDVEVQTLTL